MQNCDSTATVMLHKWLQLMSYRVCFDKTTLTNKTSAL